MGDAMEVPRDRIRRQIAHIAIALELRPGPALGLVEDGDQFAPQGLGIQGRVEAGGTAQGRAGCAHLAGFARHIAGRIYPAAQGLGSQIIAIGMEPGIEGRSGAHPYFPRKNSKSARAPWGSPPLGLAGLALGTQPKISKCR